MTQLYCQVYVHQCFRCRCLCQSSGFSTAEQPYCALLLKCNVTACADGVAVLYTDAVAAAASDSEDGFEMLDETPPPAGAAAAAAADAGVTSAGAASGAGAKRKREAATTNDDEAGPSSGFKRAALADGLSAVHADPDDDDCIILE